MRQTYRKDFYSAEKYKLKKEYVENDDYQFLERISETLVKDPKLILYFSTLPSSRQPDIFGRQ